MARTCVSATIQQRQFVAAFHDATPITASRFRQSSIAASFTSSTSKETRGFLLLAPRGHPLVHVAPPPSMGDEPSR